MDATVSKYRLRTPQEAADFLGIKVQTLAVWRTTKRYAIPFIRVGNAIRYRQSDLEKWLAERTVTPETGDH
jgi:excisionase family DNA binding protein